MARFEVTSDATQLIRNLELLGLYDNDTQKEVLTGCGEILVKKIKELFSSDWKTMETFQHVVLKPKINRDRNGVPYVTVTVKGTREDGVRYATVAFVLNYGRREEYGHIAGSHYWNRAIEVTEEEMTQLIEEIVTRKIHEANLA